MISLLEEEYYVYTYFYDAERQNEGLHMAVSRDGIKWTPGNQTYLGTADPNNPWSVFNYSIEVKSNGQVGYAKYHKQPQQEFLLEFQDKFKVKEIAFEPKAVVKMCIRDRNIIFSHFYYNINIFFSNRRRYKRK